MITIDRLTKFFAGRSGTVVALDDISLHIPEGSLFGLVGPVGAGKSTLTRCVTLRERPDRGSVRLEGTNLLALTGGQLREARRRIGVLGADGPLLSGRTVAGNVAMPLEQAGVTGPDRRRKVATLLDVMELTERAATYPDQLTDGQRRRISLARALACDPAVLVADEPTEGLAAGESDAVLTVLDRVRTELGVTVLVATRNPSVASRICDDVAVLDRGHLIEHGRLIDLIAEVGGWTADAVLPPIPEPVRTSDFHRVVTVVLIGFASVAALLPEAGLRFGVEISVIGGGLVRLGDTPVARFQLGLRGERSDQAVAWIADRGAIVHGVPSLPCGAAA